MSDKKLDLILEKLDQMDKRFDRNDDLLEQVIRMLGDNNKSSKVLTETTNTHDHHLTIIDKQLVNHAIEIEKLKSR